MGRPPGSHNKPKEYAPGEKAPKGLTLREMVPKGPYKSEAEKWDAISTFIRVKVGRERGQLSPLRDSDLEKWMGINLKTILSETKRPAYIMWKASVTKSQMWDMLTDQSEDIREIYRQLILEAKNTNDTKQKKEVMGLLNKIAEDFGFNKVQLGDGDTGPVENVEDLVKEAKEIIESCGGTVRSKQNIIDLVMNGIPSRREVSVHTGPVEGCSTDGPVPPVSAVPVAGQASPV